MHGTGIRVAMSARAKGQTVYEVPRVVRLRERESRMVVVRGWGRRGHEELVFDRTRVSVWEDENILEMDSGAGCTAV